jgi:hypothetical protein
MLAARLLALLVLTLLDETVCAQPEYDLSNCGALMGRHWRILVVQEPPLIQIHDQKKWTNKDHFELTTADILPRDEWNGYIIDYLHELQSRCLFEYTLYLPGELTSDIPHPLVGGPSLTVPLDYDINNAGTYTLGVNDVEMKFADFYW